MVFSTYLNVDNLREEPLAFASQFSKTGISEHRKSNNYSCRRYTGYSSRYFYVMDISFIKVQVEIAFRNYMKIYHSVSIPIDSSQSIL